jgi:hypothetical protein
MDDTADSAGARRGHPPARALPHAAPEEHAVRVHVKKELRRTVERRAHWRCEVCGSRFGTLVIVRVPGPEREGADGYQLVHRRCVGGA